MDNHLARLMVPGISKGEVISSLHCLGYDIDYALDHHLFQLLSIERLDWAAYVLDYVSKTSAERSGKADHHMSYCRLCKGEM